MGQVCIDIHDKAVKDKVAQNINATIRVQMFDFFNLLQLVSNDPKKKPMNKFLFGKMVTSYTNNCSTDLELSDKIKTIIDFQFENKTSFYFYK